MLDCIYDENLKVADVSALTSSAAGTVDGVAKVITLGAGKVEGKLYVDVSAISIANNNELYKISLQGSDNSDFSTGDEEDLAILELGANEVLGGDQDSETGRYVVPFVTEKHGVIYPYVRIYTTISGTAPSISFAAWLGK